jgi:hypothetical protein
LFSELIKHDHATNVSPRYDALDQLNTGIAGSEPPPPPPLLFSFPYDQSRELANYLNEEDTENL